VPGVPPDVFVFLGSHGGEGDGKEATAYWAVDVSEVEGARFGGAGEESAFVDLRTLMVAADWRDKDAMGELAIAGHVCVTNSLQSRNIHYRVTDIVVPSKA
jgi:NAD+ diphosphatase